MLVFLGETSKTPYSSVRYDTSAPRAHADDSSLRPDRGNFSEKNLEFGQRTGVVVLAQSFLTRLVEDRNVVKEVTEHGVRELGVVARTKNVRVPHIVHFLADRVFEAEGDVDRHELLVLLDTRLCFGFFHLAIPREQVGNVVEVPAEDLCDLLLGYTVYDWLDHVSSFLRCCRVGVLPTSETSCRMDRCL